MEIMPEIDFKEHPRIWISGIFVGRLYGAAVSDKTENTVWLDVCTESGDRRHYGPFGGYLCFNPEVYTFEEFEGLRKARPDVYKHEVVVEWPTPKPVERDDEEEFINPVYDIRPESLINFFEAVALGHLRLTEEQRGWMRTYLSSHRVERGK